MNPKVPYKIKSIDFSNIVFKTPKVVKNKKIIFLKYNDLPQSIFHKSGETAQIHLENKVNNNFVIQLSKLENNIILDSNEFEVEIKNSDQLNFINQLDDYIISNAEVNAADWFSHLDDKSSINYQRMLNDNDELEIKTLKLKIINNENFKSVITLNDELIDDFSTLIESGETNYYKSDIILEIYAVWIKNNNFGLLLRPVNLSLKYSNVYNYTFINDSESESEDNSLFLKNIVNKETIETTSDYSDTENNIINFLK